MARSCWTLGAGFMTVARRLSSRTKQRIECRWFDLYCWAPIPGYQVVDAAAL